MAMASISAHGHDHEGILDQMGYGGQDLGAEWRPDNSAKSSSVVELSVSCRNLSGVSSKSGPRCLLFVKEDAVSQWEEHGRTEIAWNNSNPNFIKKFVLDYSFEEAQWLEFEVYDVDSDSPDSSRNVFLGRIEVTLGEVVRSKPLKKTLQGITNGGEVIVYTEELDSCKDVLSAEIRGHELDKKSSPFLKFYRSNEDGTKTVVHQSECIKASTNVNWQPFTVSVRALCNGDYRRSLTVECLDWKQNGQHDLIGCFYTTVHEMTRAEGTMFDLVHPKKKADKKYKSSGKIELVQASIQQNFTFLDYIRGGTEIQCIIAVDFTESNGNQKDPASLHYMGSEKPNMYVRALTAVGKILEDYDTDKQLPAFGFGARVPPGGRVKHDFALNGSTSNPACAGIDGVVKAYQRTLKTIQLYGPTNFAPVIEYVANLARQANVSETYFILLILTDGIITDMPQTAEAIVQASTLPLSIIIVGIGDADFTEMDELDGDDNRLSSRGKEADRDIVQFVPFRNFLDKGDVSSQTLLAKEVLAEIPHQFLSYMEKNSIAPNPVSAQVPPSTLSSDPHVMKSLVKKLETLDASGAFNKF